MIQFETRHCGDTTQKLQDKACSVSSYYIFNVTSSAYKMESMEILQRRCRFLSAKKTKIRTELPGTQTQIDTHIHLSFSASSAWAAVPFRARLEAVV